VRAAGYSSLDGLFMGCQDETCKGKQLPIRLGSQLDVKERDTRAEVGTQVESGIVDEVVSRACFRSYSQSRQAGLRLREEALAETCSRFLFH
jgi:hypothetical protein